MESLLTTRQAATFLSISMVGVYASIRRGRLPAHKFGRDWLIKLADLEAYQANRHKTGRPRKPR